MTADDAEQEPTERAPARPVPGAARAALGFTNRTDMVTLDKGELVVLRRYRRWAGSRAGACHMIVSPKFP